jgi:MoaA/NifB/PqqE/SkfB family radical SAM enzyme
VSRREDEADELSTDEILRLLTEAASAGCLFLLISGGEPFLRSDFVDIYAGARQLGLVVTVFTNATMLSREHEEVFRAYPPRRVEVSLYGATEATYERVTGVAGSFNRAMRGVDRLKEIGVRVGLKTVLLKQNAHEIQSIRALAQERGAKFRTDSLVTPRLDGDMRPVAHRLDVVSAVQLELERQEQRDDWAEYIARQHGAVSISQGSGPGRLYRCGAGVGSFHIDSQGVMRPCLISRELSYSCRTVSFDDGWRQVVEAVESCQQPAPEACVGCADMLYCGYCPGLFELDGGPSPKRDHYCCELGAERRKQVVG